VGLWLSKTQLNPLHDPAQAKGVGLMITRTSQPASGAMLISEMKEFAGFPKATQRYIRRSLDVAYGRRDPIECWARDEGEAASIRAQARLYKQLDHLRLQVPDDSGLDMIEPFMGMLITLSAFDLGQDRLQNFAAFRFLYERLIGAASRPWLPAAFCAAAALPHLHPERRRILLQSISESAATAPGWSSREPVFWPEWVEKVDKAAA
jgi:hypothetical protein